MSKDTYPSGREVEPTNRWDTPEADAANRENDTGRGRYLGVVVLRPDGKAPIEGATWVWFPGAISPTLKEGMVSVKTEDIINAGINPYNDDPLDDTDVCLSAEVGSGAAPEVSGIEKRGFKGSEVSPQLTD